MNASRLYNQLVAQGIALTTDGAHLEIEGPNDALTDALVECIRVQKRALIAHLRPFVGAKDSTAESAGTELTVAEVVAITTLRHWLSSGAIAALPADVQQYGYYRDRAECARRAAWYLADALRADPVGSNARWWICDVVGALTSVCKGDLSRSSSGLAVALDEAAGT